MALEVYGFPLSAELEDNEITSSAAPEVNLAALKGRFPSTVDYVCQAVLRRRLSWINPTLPPSKKIPSLHIYL